MRIPSGSTNRYIYFVAVDATDLKTRETGLSSFTVYRSRNGGAAAAMTTPTVNETDATNMPGVYELLLDEDTTIDSGHDSQEMVLHITASGMAPVSRVIELYRPKITEGETLGVTSSKIAWNTDWATPVKDEVVNGCADLHLDYLFYTSYDPDSKPGVATALLNELIGSDAGVSQFTANALELAPAGGGGGGDATEAKQDIIIGYLDTEIAAIKAKTDNLPSDPADASDISSSFGTVNSTLSIIAGYLDTEIAAIKAKTDNLPTDPADQSAVEAAITAATTGLATAASIAALNNLSAAQVNAEVDTALADIHLDHLLAATYDPASKPGAADALLNELIGNDTGVSQFTANALELAPSGGGGGGDATEAKQDIIIGYLDTEIAAIKAKTDNLPSDPADQSAVEAAITAATTGLATAAALAVVDANVDDILVDTGTALPAQIAGLSTGAGSGAYTITVTVTDGTDPLQGATVRVIEGVNNFSAVTDASGEAVFALDAATYSVAVTKAGYSLTPTTRTVTGEEAGTLTNDLEMTAVALASISTSARTMKYRDLLHGVARRRGLDPSVNLQHNEAAAITEYLNAGYLFCWRHYQWPESITIEQATAADQLIAWEGATTYRLGDVIKVTVNHPVTSTNPTPVSFTLGPEGIYLPSATYADSELWVTYRREAPRFTSTVYASGTAYTVGDYMYFTDGDCYRCLAATTAGQTPVTHAAKWQRQDVLAILAEATKQYALSECLREDGQHATSMITDGSLESLLDHEIDRLNLDQGQTETYRFYR